LSGSRQEYLHSIAERFTLEVLDISQNDISYCVDVFKNLKDAVFLSNLVELNMSKNPLNYKAAVCIKSTISVCTKLEKLNLSHCDLKWGACSLILTGLKTNRMLKSLDISGNDCGNSTKFTLWGELFKANNVIQTLILNNCSLGDLQTREIARNLHLNKSLRALHLSHN